MLFLVGEGVQMPDCLYQVSIFNAHIFMFLDDVAVRRTYT